MLLLFSACSVEQDKHRIEAEPDQIEEPGFESIDHALNAIQVEEKVDFYERLNLVSEAFKGTPFSGGPNGEGAHGKYDIQSELNLRAFDCTTFVESITALAMGQSEKGVLKHLRNIRYRNEEICFTGRNHFVSLDWIPHNIENGYFEDITQEVWQTTKHQIARIDQKKWIEKTAKGRIKGQDLIPEQDRLRMIEELKEEYRDASPKDVKIKYIPFEEFFLVQYASEDAKRTQIEAEKNNIQELQRLKKVVDETDAYDEWVALNLEIEELQADINEARYRKYLHAKVNQELLDNIPSGTLLNWVREKDLYKKYIDTEMNIYHQTYVFEEEDGLMIRQPSFKSVVEDIPLIEYIRTKFIGTLSKDKGYPSASNWLGVHLMRPTGKGE